MKKIFHLLFFLIFVSHYHPYRSQTTVIVGKDLINLTNRFVYLEDSSGVLDFKEILQRPVSEFKTNTASSFSYPLTKFPLWFKFRVINLSYDKIFIRIDNPRLDTLRLFYYNPEKKKYFSKVLTPNARREERIVNSPTIILELPYCDKDGADYYMKVTSRRLISMPMSVGRISSMINDIIFSTALDFCILA